MVTPKTSLPAFFPHARFRALPDKVQRQLLACPQSGQGVHAWLYPTACSLHDCCVDEDTMWELIELACQDCGRLVDSHEIADAIANSALGRRQPRKETVFAGSPTVAKSPTQPKWPSRNYAAIEAIARNGDGLSALPNSGVALVDEPSRSTEQIVSTLFPGNPLICCGQKNNSFETKPLDRWDRMDTLPFIVPNAMTALNGTTKNGKPSSRSLSNTGPRCFLVIEFDFNAVNKDGSVGSDGLFLDRLGADGISTADLNISLHVHLAQFLPLALIVHSGSRSEHGWYSVRQQSEERASRFMAYAASLGADTATFCRCQLVRMPGGTREGTGKRQVVRYFEPKEVY